MIKIIFETGLIYDGQMFGISFLHPALSYLEKSFDKNGYIIIGETSQAMLTSSPAITNEKNIDEERKAAVENELAETIARLIMDSITNALSQNTTMTFQPS